MSIKRILWICGIVLAVLIVAYVTVRLVMKEERRKYLTLYGNVDVRQVDMGFRVNGMVQRLVYEEGDVVKAGSLVAQLDKSPYDSEVRRAEAQVAAIAVRLDNAQILLDRRQALIEVGGVSQEDLDNALSDRNQLKADLAQAQAELKVAQDNFAYTDIYAPTDGIILTRIREPGSVVRSSEPVYTLSVISPVWIRAYVDEPNLGLVEYGMKAKVYTDTKGGVIYRAHVGFISPVSEFTPKTVETTELRTDLVYRLRLYVDNPDWSLKQGMPVTVKIPLKRYKE